MFWNLQEIVMRELISTKIYNVYSDFSRDIRNQCLCELKKLRYDKTFKPDYSNKLVQQFYILRYFPAYLCEYKYIYTKILESNLLDTLNILSIGCGCCVDYSAAFLAANKNNNRKTWKWHNQNWSHWKRWTSRTIRGMANQRRQMVQYIPGSI